MYCGHVIRHSDLFNNNSEIIYRLTSLEHDKEYLFLSNNFKEGVTGLLTAMFQH